MEVKKWVIKEFDNILVSQQLQGIFFSAEAYVIRWGFQISVSQRGREEKRQFELTGCQKIHERGANGYEIRGYRKKLGEGSILLSVLIKGNSI